jgi:hypothetical protein
MSDAVQVDGTYGPLESSRIRLARWVRIDTHTDAQVMAYVADLDAYRAALLADVRERVAGTRKAHTDVLSAIDAMARGA